VDVGVWKGQSAVTLARAMARHVPEGAVIAVDTFLGSPEHWNPGRPDRMMDGLLMTHGWPGLYCPACTGSSCRTSSMPVSPTGSCRCRRRARTRR
jgi:hypothetical protein